TRLAWSDGVPRAHRGGYADKLGPKFCDRYCILSLRSCGLFLALLRRGCELSLVRLSSNGECSNPVPLVPPGRLELDVHNRGSECKVTPLKASMVTIVRH